MMTKYKEIIEKDILTYLPENIRCQFELIPDCFWDQIHEIRFRAGQYPSVSTLNSEQGLNEIRGLDKAVKKVTQDDINKIVSFMNQNSIYAIQEEIKAGFFTLRGGHRVGLAGRVISNSGLVQNIKHFSSLNIRIARQVIGAADKVIDYLIMDKDFVNTLIVSPPRCGKTTILRDLIRQASNGIPRLNLMGKTVGLVDERSELAACYKGVPQNDVGIRTDVLDNCPKHEGIIMMVRAMGPNIIATDEIGSMDDAKAILTAVNTGIAVIVTAHGKSMEDIQRRPGLARLVEDKVFKRIVILDNSRGPGTVRMVYDGEKMKPVYLDITEKVV